MASLGLEESNATTVCPFLTYSGYDAQTDEYFCDYEPWAYGLFAIACLLLIVVPLVLIICCVLNTRKRKRACRLRSAVSNNSYSSSEAPYQPLLRNSQQNYGALDPEPSSPSGLSPNDESTSQQHDNTSIASSKASLLPNYDQVSLEIRNSTAFHHNAQKSSEAFGKQNPKNEVDLIADSITPLKNVPHKTKSPIYAVLEEALPDEFNNKSNKKSEIPAEKDPTYSELEPPEKKDNSITEKNHDVESNKQLSENNNKEKNTPRGGIDELYTIPEVNYAQINKKPRIHTNSIEPAASQDIMQGEKDPESTNSSPVYNILEPLLPDVEIPEREKKQEIKETTEGPPDNQDPDSEVGEDGNCDNAKLSSECRDNPEAIYTPLLPTKEWPKGNAEDPSNEPDAVDYQPLTPSEQRKRLISRTDYEEFLLEMIKHFPENERNGCFVVRDSVTNPGSKALTVYSKSSTSEKEMFNFKLCFDEGQVYLAKSNKCFKSLEELLQYLRTNKDMLPCTLTHRIN